MRTLVCLVVLFASFTAVHAQAPTTRPAGPSVAELQAAASDAARAVDQLKADTLKKWEESAERRVMAADVDAKRVALEKARAGSDPQAKLDASAAYNKARLQLEARTKDATAETAALIVANKRLADARAAHQKAVADEEAARLATAQAAEDADPIRKAIKEKRIVVGMTIEQVRLATGDKGLIDSETESRQTYKFVASKESPSGQRVYYRTAFVDVKEGRVVSFYWGPWRE